MQYKESRDNNQQPTLQLPQILEFFLFIFFLLGKCLLILRYLFLVLQNK